MNHIKYPIGLCVFLIFSINLSIISVGHAKSFAMEVAEAGKINRKLRDVREDQMPDLRHTKSGYSAGDAATDTALTVGTATKALSSGGIGSGVASGILALGFILPKDKSSVYPSILGWMPEEMAKDKLEARKEYRNIVELALSKSLSKDYALSSIGKWKHASNSSFDVLPLSGKECGDNDCAASFSGFSSQKNYGGIAKIKKSPSFITHPKSWALIGDQGRIFFLKKDNSASKGFKNINGGYQFHKELSKHLPKWCYVYMPATDQFPQPIIFNQGEEHYFIK